MFYLYGGIQQQVGQTPVPFEKNFTISAERIRIHNCQHNYWGTGGSTSTGEIYGRIFTLCPAGL